MTSIYTQRYSEKKASYQLISQGDRLGCVIIPIQNCEKIDFFLFKSLSIRYAVVAALTSPLNHSEELRTYSISILH